AAVARPIFAACEDLGIKAFLDQEHIGWGQQFTAKINSALGAARVVLAVVSPTSVEKEWPVAEVNAALGLEVEGEKQVIVVLVGRPTLQRLPLLRQKNYLVWDGDADAVAQRLKKVLGGGPDAPDPPSRGSRPPTPAPRAAEPAARPRKGLLGRWFGRG
ncbi:MAG: toll/interleukin-1 receptor domain-containing protein, partial [Pseudomonadota bacterium]